MLDAEQRGRIVRMTASDISIGGKSDPRELAATLWPPEPVVAVYERVDRTLIDRQVAEATSAEAVLRAQLLLDQLVIGDGSHTVKTTDRQPGGGLARSVVGSLGQWLCGQARPHGAR